MIYATGESVPKDSARAVIWFDRAAGQGDLLAQIGLGFMYENGEGVPRDSAKALQWQARVAIALANTSAAPKNHAEAVKWISQAAEKGFANAEATLGIAYEHGYGCLLYTSRCV